MIDRSILDCSCSCHDGPGKPCTEPGGCGSFHANYGTRQRQNAAAVTAQIHAAATTAQIRTEAAADADSEDQPPEGLSDVELAELRQRRCARDRRCPDKQRVEDDNGDPIKVDGPRGQKRTVYVGALIDTDRGLCTICTQTARNEIPHLAADWRELAGLLAAGGDASGEMVASSRDLPVPIRLSVEALMREIDVDTTLWAEQVADALGIDWDIEAAWSSRDHVRVEKASRILASAVDTLVQLPAIDRDRYRDGERRKTWRRDDREGGDVLSTGVTGWLEYTYWQQDGLDAALRMLDLHERTRILAGRSELVHRLPAPCPNPRCGRLTLVRPNGKDHVECESCRERWPETDYIRLTLVLSDEENRRIKACDRCDNMGRLPTRRREMCGHQKQRTAA